MEFQQIKTWFLFNKALDKVSERYGKEVTQAELNILFTIDLFNREYKERCSGLIIEKFLTQYQHLPNRQRLYKMIRGFIERGFLIVRKDKHRITGYLLTNEAKAMLNDLETGLKRLPLVKE